jgi:hypothetical protein
MSITISSELLSYVNFFRDRSTTDALKEVICTFYSATEIAESKKSLLLSKLPNDCPLKRRRVNSSVRQAYEPEVDDIVGMFNTLDSQELLDDIVFVARAIDRLPGVYSPEEVKLCSIVDRQNHTEASIISLSASLEKISVSGTDGTAVLGKVSTAIDQSNEKMHIVTQSMQNQIDQLTLTCGKLVEAVQSSANKNLPVKSSSDDPDRSVNIIVTGIKENRDNAAWRNIVAKVLLAATGKEVEIVDAFRIGRFNTGKTRPILVKLRSVWDRRLVLSGRRKLNDIEELKRCVYISPDEPLDVRRRATMQRLLKKAERDDKKVDLTNGVLKINDVIVYTIEDGYIHSGSDGASASV